MNLWIRSQDKKDLINVSEYLSIEETNFSEDIEYVKNPNKRPFFIECSNCILGFYATEERALEVLDEIQKLLKDETTETEIRYIDNQEYERIVTKKPNIPKGKVVYEMPEE